MLFIICSPQLPRTPHPGQAASGSGLCSGPCVLLGTQVWEVRMVLCLFLVRVSHAPREPLPSHVKDEVIVSSQILICWVKSLGLGESPGFLCAVTERDS